MINKGRRSPKIEYNACYIPRPRGFPPRALASES